MIYRRGKSLYVEFWYRKHRYRKSLGPVSLETARKEERRWRKAVAEAVYAPKPAQVAPTLWAFAREFVPWYAAQHRPGSTRVVQGILKPWVVRHGHMRLDTLTTRLIEADKTRLLEMGLSPNYVNTHLRVWRHVLRTAAAWGLLSRDGLPVIQLVRHERAERRVLSPDEERRLSIALPVRLRPLVTLALHTGLRHAELLQLRWQDLDAERRTLTIPAARAKGRRVRTIPLNASARAALHGLPDYGPESRVFGYRSIHSMFVRARRRAGLPEAIKIHTLRHTFATRALRQGIDLRTLQKWLGHQSIATTELYTHPVSDYEHQLILRLDEVPPESPSGLYGGR